MSVVLKELPGRDAIGRDQSVVQGIDTEKLSLHSGRESGGIDTDSDVGKARDRVGARHHGEFSKGEGIGRWAELAGVLSLLEILTVLDEVKAPGAAAIVTAEEPSFGIKAQDRRYCRRRRRRLRILSVRGMVSPDDGAFVVNRRIIEAGSGHAAGGGAALSAVEPAVGSPGETIGHAVRVFEAETGESDFGVAVGNVVSIFDQDRKRR